MIGPTWNSNLELTLVRARTDLLKPKPKNKPTVPTEDDRLVESMFALLTIPEENIINEFEDSFEAQIESENEMETEDYEPEE